MRNAALTYRQLVVQGATPLGLVVMLYDGAIAAMQRAIMTIEAHNIEEKCKHLNRALAIILQLEGTLNFEREERWPGPSSPFTCTRAPKL